MMSIPIKEYSVGAVAGVTIFAIINLGMFATKEEMAKLRAYIAETYMPRQEVKAELANINTKLDKLLERMMKQ